MCLVDDSMSFQRTKDRNLTFVESCVDWTVHSTPFLCQGRLKGEVGFIRGCEFRTTLNK